MTFFTPWLTGALMANGALVALYLVVGRVVDPVGWGFALVAVITMQMLASVGTEIVWAIKERGR